MYYIYFTWNFPEAFLRARKRTYAGDVQGFALVAQIGIMRGGQSARNGWGGAWQNLETC